MSTTAEIREALESVVRNVGNELILRTENAWGLERWSCCHKDVDGEHSSTCPAVLTLNNASRALALLADMEREGEPAKVVTTIKGWVRPAGVDVHGPGYELGSGCGWCEFNEVGQPDHGDQPATLIIGTHPSPTAADAKDSAVDVQEVIRAGDAMANRLKIMETGAGLQAVWSEIIKTFRP